MKWEISTRIFFEKICYFYGQYQYLYKEPWTLKPLYLSLPEFTWIYLSLPKFTWRLHPDVSHKSAFGNQEIRQLELWNLAQWEVSSVVPGKVLWRKCIGGLGAKINQQINRHLCEITGGPHSLYLNLPKITLIYLNVPEFTRTYYVPFMLETWEIKTSQDGEKLPWTHQTDVGVSSCFY